MLAMCENLAAGLGAAVKPPPGAKGKEKSTDTVGNAPLRTWVGTRSLGKYLLLSDTQDVEVEFCCLLEIYKRNGNAPAAKRQETANRAMQNAIRKAEKRSAAQTVDR